MSMSDPIADLLTRVRNACLRRHNTVACPYSKTNYNIVKILQEEGFIGDFNGDKENGISLNLKYYSNQKEPVIRKIQRVSKPGLRVYKGYKELNPVMSGQGIYIISTSQGVVSDNMCRERKIGGEILCMVY